MTDRRTNGPRKVLRSVERRKQDKTVKYKVSKKKVAERKKMRKYFPTFMHSIAIKQMVDLYDSE